MIKGQDQVRELIKLGADENLPVLLIGETGCGKTSLVRELAQQFKRTVRRFNMTGETSVDDFVGKYTLRDKQTHWEDGILVQAMKEGQWLVVDEINMALPEILSLLHSLLDDDKFITLATHNGEVVRPHKDFRFFATMNPVDDYAGTKDLNRAFASRFPLTIRVEYPALEVEAEVVQEQGISAEDAAKMVDVGRAIRQAKADGKVFYTCSTRDLLQWASLTPKLGLQRAFEVTVLGKVDNERADIIGIYRQVMGKYEVVEGIAGASFIEEIAKKLEQIAITEKEMEQRILEQIQKSVVGNRADKAKTEAEAVKAVA